ncbi:hypothetical protein D3Z58_11015 [Clostridiaceae bacterium]|nr:hypothetical protein [Clostridiaceae bacterium]
MDIKTKSIYKNILMSFLIKGAAIVVSMITIPEYIKYFHSQAILGVWYAILNILTWITMFDLGIGNGLRNKLTEAITKEDQNEQRMYISSTYMVASVFCIIMVLSSIIIVSKIDWNKVLNISTEIINSDILKKSIIIVFIGVGIHFVTKLVTSILYALQKSALVSLLALLSNFCMLIYMILANQLNLKFNLVTISIVHVIAINIPYFIATIFLFHTSLKEKIPNIKYFESNHAKNILNIGIILLWLQVAMMFVGCSHSIIISRMISPEEVTDFNIYFKLFNGMASVFTLALSPIWSGVTKAQSERDYKWILSIEHKLWKLLAVASLACVLLILILQRIFNLWLSSNTIEVNFIKALTIAIFTIIFVLHNINTSLSNGLSTFKVQFICMTIASLAFVPISYFLQKFIQNWASIVMASSICLLPYEIIQPILTNRFLKKSIRKSGE